MDIRFGCTQCGACCRGHKLPLTVGEAIGWLNDGHPVQILCDAMPWTEEPAPDDLRAAHRRRRSFPTLSGAVPVRVIAILVADLGPACPNLQPDLRCAIHARRPLVCRVYPAEINPFVTLSAANKLCPAEAWSTSQPPLQVDGRIVDTQVASDILASRNTDAAEVQVKARLCAALRIDHAALANEGFAVYEPEPAALLAALVAAAAAPDTDVPRTAWHIGSNRAATVSALNDIGSSGEYVSGDGPGFRYLGFHPPAPAATP